MHYRQPYYFYAWALILFATTLSGCASGPSKENDSVYISSESPMQDVQNALNRAKLNDKLLLIVMGAQWCHDSRGLVDNFQRPQLNRILEQSYELIYLDVGYYKDLRTISNRFGQAHYFATPTVMIIDPASEQLINTDDMAMWGNADSIPFATYLEYFGKYTDTNIKALAQRHSGISTEHILAILDFESRNAERLQYAYGMLVPDMIEEDLTGKYSDTFIARWNEVRAYRMKLQADIQTLYKQAKTKPSTALVFPSYPPFSWEN